MNHGRSREAVNRVLSPSQQALAATAGVAHTGLSAPRGDYPKWAWLVALLGIPGGLIGYFALLPTNEDAARGIFKAGLAVQVLFWIVWLAYVGAQTISSILSTNALFAVLQ
jgi:hypothetical protein